MYSNLKRPEAPNCDMARLDDALAWAVPRGLRTRASGRPPNPSAPSATPKGGCRGHECPYAPTQVRKSLAQGRERTLVVELLDHVPSG